jgi:hypothetical protein
MLRNVHRYKIFDIFWTIFNYNYYVAPFFPSSHGTIFKFYFEY